MTSFSLHDPWRIVLLDDEGGECAIEVDAVTLYSNGYVLYESTEGWRAVVPPHRVAEITLKEAEVRTSQDRSNP